MKAARRADAPSARGCCISVKGLASASLDTAKFEEESGCHPTAGLARRLVVPSGLPRKLFASGKKENLSRGVASAPRRFAVYQSNNLKGPDSSQSPIERNAIAHPIGVGNGKPAHRRIRAGGRRRIREGD